MSTIAARSRISLKNILFATDLSECANRALPYALSVARRYGATIHPAYIMPADSAVFYMSPADWAVVAEADEKRIRGYRAALENQVRDVPHQVMTPRGNIWDALGQIIKEHKIDTVVLGTHGRTGIRKLALGSIAEEIFRRAPCPVLTIGPHVSQKPDGEAKFHHILFATDFSSESLAALPYAISLAEEDEAQLALLHVVSQPAAGVVNLAAVTASLVRRLKELVPLDAEPWCHPLYLVEFGQQFPSPAEAILKVAEHSATALIVLGVRSMHGKPGLVTHLASTTAQILAQAACPVLTVRG